MTNIYGIDAAGQAFVRQAEQLAEEIKDVRSWSDGVCCPKVNLGKQAFNSYLAKLTIRQQTPSELHHAAKKQKPKSDPLRSYASIALPSIDLVIWLRQ